MDGRGWCDIGFSGGPMDVGFPDEITTTGGSELALRYVTGGQPGAGVSYSGTFRVVNMGFPFETINDSVTRSSVMDGVLGFLFCTATESPETSCGDGVDNDCDGLVDGDDPDCQTCLPAGASCTDNADCCSNKCKGKAGSKTCK